MSLAAALKKGQAAIDTLGNWDPFSETAGAPAPAKPAARTLPANVNGSDERPAGRPSPRPAAHLRAVRDEQQGRAAQPRSAQPNPAQAQPAQPNPAQPYPAPHRPTEARAVLSAKAARPAPKGRGKAAWLHDGMPGQGSVNAAQYVRELDRFIADEARRAVADTVMDVNPSEIEGVAKLAARIKGRYLAKLLDLGNPSKSTVQDTEVRELTRYRETYEELARGLDMLKAAIEAGDVGVSGMVRR